MAKAKTLVGLDVHASKVVAAMLDAETGELRFNRLPGGTDRTLALCAGLEPPVQAVYEAGPTGFGLARALGAAGVDCLVAAPARSRARPRIASRRTAATPRTWCACCSRASSSRCASLRAKRRPCATSCERARTCAAT